jgi:TfoX/Sxy family transcriptional regulator of competence genes
LDEAIHLDLSGMLFFNSIVKGNANRLKGGRSARHACNRKVEFNIVYEKKEKKMVVFRDWKVERPGESTQ